MTSKSGVEALVWASVQGFSFVQALRMKKLLCFISNYSVHNSFWILLNMFTHAQFHPSEWIQSELRFILVLFIRTMNTATSNIHLRESHTVYSQRNAFTLHTFSYHVNISHFLNRLRKQSDSSHFFPYLPDYFRSTASLSIQSDF